MSRPRGFINWEPLPATADVLSNVKAVLAEYEDYLPLTIRQVFYRLVAEHGFDKTEQAYKRLVEYIGKARRAELVDMSAIRDDGFYMSYLPNVGDVEDALADLQTIAEGFTLDRQRGQERPLTLWCEAKGMVPMLERAAAPYGVAVASSGGFDSITAQHSMGRRLGATSGHILHLGDFDPSGEHVFSALAENLQSFGAAYGGGVDCTRIAVIAEQVEEYGLPTAPPKETDRRSFTGTATTQLEAFAPDQLIALVVEEIESRMDLDIYQAVLVEEAEMRAELRRRLGV